MTLVLLVLRAQIGSAKARDHENAPPPRIDLAVGQVLAPLTQRGRGIHRHVDVAVAQIGEVALPEQRQDEDDPDPHEPNEMYYAKVANLDVPYLLIAGSYTPFGLVIVNGPLSLSMPPPLPALLPEMVLLVRFNVPSL